MTDLDKQLRELDRQYFIEFIQIVLMGILKYNPLTQIVKFLGRFFMVYSHGKNEYLYMY